MLNAYTFFIIYICSIQLALYGWAALTNVLSMYYLTEHSTEVYLHHNSLSSAILILLSNHYTYDMCIYNLTNYSILYYVPTA